MEGENQRWRDRCAGAGGSERSSSEVSSPLQDSLPEEARSVRGSGEEKDMG